MLPITLHTFDHRAANTATTRGRRTVPNPTFGVPTTYRGIVQPESFNATFMASGVEMKRPHKVFANPEVEGNIKVGDMIDYEGEEFVVKTPTAVHRGFGGTIDHVTFYMDDADGNG